MSVRLTLSVPLSTSTRVVVDHKVDEFRVQLGKWDISLEGDYLVVRAIAHAFDTSPLLKVPAE